MQTIELALKEVSSALDAAGIENARFEARLIVCHALSVETSTLIGYPEREISTQDQTVISDILKRRLSREPMSQILGEREFWSLTFKVTKDTLTPRPDSETLIEAVLDHLPDLERSLAVIDLGVGTGCLLLSVLSEYRQARGIGVDLSEAALTVARENADKLNLSDRTLFQNGNWLAGIDGTFDLILSNPPYIPLSDRDILSPEVRDHEPDTALFAGDDGLDDYRILAEQIPNRLKPGAIAVIELGIYQGKDVSELMIAQGLEVLEVRKDLGGIERCLVLRKKT